MLDFFDPACIRGTSVVNISLGAIRVRTIVRTHALCFTLSVKHARFSSTDMPPLAEPLFYIPSAIFFSVPYFHVSFLSFLLLLSSVSPS